MHPFLRIKNNIRKGSSTSGTVVSVEGQTAVVSTRFGVKLLDIPIGLTLIATDEVRVESEAITGKIRSSSNLPVFTV